jgi:hypothetical protein
METASFMHTQNEFNKALFLIELKLNELVIELHNTARAIENQKYCQSQKAQRLRKIADSISDIHEQIKNEINLP